MSTPVLPGKQMSSSLKERLKRAGRSYTSPCVKKLKVAQSVNASPGLDNNDGDADSPSQFNKGTTSTETTNVIDNKTHPIPVQSKGDSNLEQESKCTTYTISPLASTPVSSKSRAPGRIIRSSAEPSSTSDSPSNSLNEECKRMKLRIKLKEEKLRKLKLVKVHRSKNDLDNLEELTQKWKKASQSALEDLWDYSTSEPKPTLTQLVDHFSLDHKMIGYNPDSETFS